MALGEICQGTKAGAALCLQGLGSAKPPWNFCG